MWLILNYITPVSRNIVINFLWYGKNLHFMPRFSKFALDVV